MAKYYNLSIRNLIYRLRKFKSVLDEELQTELKHNEDVIIKMITNEQLYERGIEGMGVEIASYAPYKYSTIRSKRYKNQPYNRVTLKDTGKFYESLELIIDDNGFYIDSYDSKAPDLLEKYGKTIFRLTNENLKILLNEYIRPSLTSKLANYIKNG